MKALRNDRTSPAPGSDFLSEQLRLLRDAGWRAHASDFERCVRALRVIRTWASFMGGMALTPKETKALCDKALASFNNPNTQPQGRDASSRPSGGAGYAEPEATK